MTFKIPAGVFDQHIILLGKTRSGKSTAMRVLAEGRMDADEPVCIIDPKGDWWGIKSSADGKKAGYPIVIFGGEHADVPINEHSGSAVAELIATGNRSCLIDLGGWMVGERTRFFVRFASTLFKLSRGQRHLLVDEVHNFAPQGKIMDPDSGKMLHWANRLASEGLGRGIAMIAASQRPQKVHKDFLTSCETLIVKQVIHKLDRVAVKDWIDGCADPDKGREVMVSLAQLKRPQAWIWSPEIDYGPVQIDFPMFKTFDSFKPQKAGAVKLQGWADVDLAEVTAKLLKVVEEAKANDPAELKRRIAELERQVKISPAPVHIDPAAADRAYKDGFDAGAAQAVEKGFDQGYAAASSAIAGIVTGVLKAGDEFMVQLRQAADTISKTPKPKASAADTLRATPIRGAEGRLSHYEYSRTKPVSTPVRIPVKTGEKLLSGLSRPQQLILDKLAWLESLGLYPAPKETLAAICDVSPASSSYTNNLGALRTAGLIRYPSGGMVDFTDAGSRAANPIESNGEIHEHWLGIVTRPRRAILEELLKHHPKAIAKDVLAERIGVSAGSSSYTNNLGGLRTLGAIDYPSVGMVGLTRYVMP